MKLHDMINEEKIMGSKNIYMGAIFKAGVDPATAKSRKTTVCNRRWGHGLVRSFAPMVIVATCNEGFVSFDSFNPIPACISHFPKSRWGKHPARTNEPEARSWD
jgi:hypothetical protein